MERHREEPRMTNSEIIRQLRDDARRYSQSGGNLYRVRALRQAAFRLSLLPGELAVLGPEALRGLGLGKKLEKKVGQWAADAVEQPV
jgi:hypothetical protein